MPGNHGKARPLLEVPSTSNFQPLLGASIDFGSLAPDPTFLGQQLTTTHHNLPIGPGGQHMVGMQPFRQKRHL